MGTWMIGGGRSDDMAMRTPRRADCKLQIAETPQAQASAEDPSVIDDPLLVPASEWAPGNQLVEDRLLWDYVSKMYVQWFRGEGEDFPELEQELRGAYGACALPFIRPSL